ncbi:Wzz/FepE/Etk N-terminal domain-containing protein [Bacteroides sp.]|uniref:Wzz/FepE/Etk N-terminal domain-containing protein n=1 Tax=Bacteroides sp. TaxID=29523 RepID=UPI00260374FE|nr:Wzz/FepE/Etk N-terminal domain-containing protein [Bacteroides sp.]MDD3040124.1 Wzz/FepE/Etk N-terminal domain-containing protein [Bacteroides sp.]
MSEKALEKKAEEMEIDLLDILRRIIAMRRMLYKATIVGIIIGVIVSLSIPKQYTVNVTLSPEMGTNKAGNGIAGLAASFLGGSTAIGEGTDALNASLSSDIVSSTPFLLELLNMQVVVDEDNQKTLSTYLEDESSPWWSYLIGLPGMAINGVKLLFADKELTNAANWQHSGVINLTKKEKEKVAFLKKNITASIDKKTAITNVTVILQDPRVAAVVADSVVHRLQEYIINYRTSKAKEDCAYLEKLFEERKQEYYEIQKKYAEYVDTHDNLILQSVRAEQERLQNDMSLAYQVYSQVANQLQVARAKVQEEKPVFAVVEPAVIPLKASGISSKVYIILFGFMAVMCTIGWMLLGKGMWTNFRAQL